MNPTVTISQLRSKSSPAQLVDVRSASEFSSGHIPGAVNIPMDQIEARVDDLDHKLPIVLICQTGKRARMTAGLLEPCGRQVAVLDGGTKAWINAGLPVVASVRTRWSLERQVRLGAGLLVLTGVILALIVNQRWLFLCGFVGLGLTSPDSPTSARWESSWKKCPGTAVVIARSPLLMRNNPGPVRNGRSCIGDSAMPQWIRGLRHISPPAQRLCLSTDDPCLRQPGRCRRRAHRSLAQGLPPSTSVARIRSLSRLAGTDRETGLLAVEAAGVVASTPAALHVGGRRPRASRIAASSGRATCPARDEATTQPGHGRVARAVPPGLRIVRCRRLARRRGRAQIRNLARRHEVAPAPRPRSG